MHDVVYDHIDEELIAAVLAPRFLKPRVRDAFCTSIRNGLTYAEANTILGRFGESISLATFQALISDSRKPSKGQIQPRGSPHQAKKLPERVVPRANDNGSMKSPAAVIWECALTRQPFPRFERD